MQDTDRNSHASIDLIKLSRRQLAYFRGNHIGYVFQSYNLIYAYTALDNVALPLLFSGATYADAVARAREVLTHVGLAERLTHRPDELSGGQQQRVAIARAKFRYDHSGPAKLCKLTDVPPDSQMRL